MAGNPTLRGGVSPGMGTGGDGGGGQVQEIGV